MALCVLAITQLGCGSKKVDEPEATQKQAVVKLQPGTWVGKSGEAEITISLAKDGRFQTVFRGGKYRSVVKGAAHIENRSILLEPKELDGKPPKNPADLKPKRLDFDSDWKTLTTDDGLALKRRI